MGKETCQGSLCEELVFKPSLKYYVNFKGKKLKRREINIEGAQ